MPPPAPSVPCSPTTPAAAGPSSVGVGDVSYLTRANAPAEVGFQFAFGLTALGGHSNTLQIGFQVTGPGVASIHLALNAISVGGAVAGAETARCPAENTGSLNTFAFLPGSQLVDSDTFDPVTTVGIIKSVTVAAAAGGGCAAVSGITQTIDLLSVPEPGSFALLGLGLVTAGFLRRRS